MAQTFLNAPEFRAGTGPRLTAFLCYSTLLLRSISADEMTLRVGQLTAGTDPQTIVESLLATTEFANLLL